MIRTFFAAIHLFLKQEGRALLQILVAHGICYPLAGKSGQQCPKESPLGDLYKLFIKEEERQNQQKLQITYFVIDKQKNRNYDLTTGKPEDAETPGAIRKGGITNEMLQVLDVGCQRQRDQAA